MRKNSIVSINSQYRENNDENNNKNNDENVSACKRGYTKNGIYNCKRELVLQIILFVLSILVL